MGKHNAKIEHQHQSAFFEWVRIKEKTNEDYRTIFAIPNGGNRDIATAVSLKREGVRAGVWDVFCATPRDGWSGLWIEFKSPGGKLRKEQKDWKLLMETRGYKLVVAFDWEEAKRQTEVYLGSTAE